MLSASSFSRARVDIQSLRATSSTAISEIKHQHLERTLILAIQLKRIHARKNSSREVKKFILDRIRRNASRLEAEKRRKKGSKFHPRGCVAFPTCNAIARANLDGINIPPSDDFTPPFSLFNDRRDTILICRRAATSSGVFESFGVIN